MTARPPAAGPGRPLVEPGPPLTRDEVLRYSRHLLLPEHGADGQRRLKNARVLVVGAGGLGSPVLSYLAAAGVGTIGVVDDDVVEVSNLQRQVVHGIGDLGRPKVASAAEAVARVNPLVRVEQHPYRLDADRAVELVSGYDLVVDGADNFPTRYLVADACELTGIPEVWGSVLRYDGQVSVFWPGHGPTYRDLFPQPPEPGAVPSCAEGGVLGAVCAALGSVMAVEVLKLLTGAGEPLVGRLLVLDALAMRWRTVPVAADPDRVPVTSIDAGSAAADGAADDTPDLPAVDALQLTALLADRAAGRRQLRLVDVRSAQEAAVVAIDGAELVPLDQVLSGRGTTGWDKDAPVVLHCKTGGRSAQALVALRQQGFRDVRHLDGGVIAWVDQVAPHLPRY